MSTSHHDHTTSRSHGHGDDGGASVNSMAASATIHCLTGCAIGEIAGLVVGTAIGLSTPATIALSVSLAFLFGYALSTVPLLKAGLAWGAAVSVVFAADTLSILTMEVVDNAVMAAIPGAMDAGLVNTLFWGGMIIALSAAFIAAYPVNRYLLSRGKGHALTHGYHDGGGSGHVAGFRRFLPSISTPALAAVLVAFMLGGLLVSAADELGAAEGGAHSTPE